MKSLRGPAAVFLIGIILIILSFSFWYFIVPPMVGLSTYSYSRPSENMQIFNGSSLTLYFGSIRFQQQDSFNKSRPVDYSMNLSIILRTTGPISMMVYIHDTSVFSFKSNATQHALEFNSSKYTLFANNQTTPPSWLYPGIHGSIPVSLGDAFTGGTTPYLIIRNLNVTNSKSQVTYSYTYTAEFRDSDGIPLLLFIVGVIIVVVYGIVLVRHLIRRTKGS
jgi:hypothetical protein